MEDEVCRIKDVALAQWMKISKDKSQARAAKQLTKEARRTNLTLKKLAKQAEKVAKPSARIATTCQISDVKAERAAAETSKVKGCWFSSLFYYSDDTPGATPCVAPVSTTTLS